MYSRRAMGCGDPRYYIELALGWAQAGTLTLRIMSRWPLLTVLLSDRCKGGVNVWLVQIRAP
jgi:hypothetical protein